MVDIRRTSKIRLRPRRIENFPRYVSDTPLIRGAIRTSVPLCIILCTAVYHSFRSRSTDNLLNEYESAQGYIAYNLNDTLTVYLERIDGCQSNS